MKRVLLIAVLIVLTASAASAQYNQAPMLEALVASGQLPPIEERLPLEPAVVTPVEEIGQYGGTWRRLHLGPSDGANVARINVDRFLFWSMDGAEVRPFVARDWDINDEGTRITFYLREGMRWSDGHPFTADDILFWWEDIIGNDELAPVKPSWMRIDGELGNVVKIDDYTVEFVFASPYPLIVEWLANAIVYSPKHYMRQFHPNYTELDVLQAQAAAADYENWWQHFNFMNAPVNNPERPVITPWIWKTNISSPVMILERNPYYWKVDTEGNQLPYIDYVHFDFVDNVEVLNLRAVNGEVDMQGRHIQLNNIPVVIAEAAANDYRVIIWPTTGGTEVGLMVNQSYDANPALGDLLRERDFRIALSHALNREEIRDLAFLGFGEGRQFAPAPTSPYYRPEFAQRFTEYDPALAEKMLDELGLTDRDSQGYRRLPDGSRLSLILETTAAFGPYVQVAELVSDYWRSVGIRTEANVQERSLYWTRMQANELMIALWDTGGAEHMFIYPYWTMPYSNISRIGPRIGDWYQSGGTRGMAPPTPELARVIELHDLAKGASEEERIVLGQEVYDLNTNNLWTIGTIGLSPMVQGVNIVKNNFRNVPEGGLENSVVVLSPGNAMPWQFFFKSE